MRKVAKETFLTIKPNSVVAFQKVIYSEHSGSNSNSKLFNLNSVSNKTKGVLSKHSIRKLRYAIELMLCKAKSKDIYHLSGKYWFSYKIGFLTLTLPCEQDQFSDSDLKRKVLMPFLQDLKRYHNLNTYIWKAEAQSNGNIHFHLTIDVFIHHQQLRTLWNEHLSRHGFIQKYREVQERWHCNGFRPRMNLIKQWPLKKQYEAYKKGIAENWENPNTIDIHSVQNINNLAAYIIKYMCKKEKGKRLIDGKLYGYSKNLNSKLKCTIAVTDIPENADNQLYEIIKDRVTEFDFCKVYDISIYKEPQLFPTFIQNLWQRYLKETESQCGALPSQQAK